MKLAKESIYRVFVCLSKNDHIYVLKFLLVK